MKWKGPVQDITPLSLSDFPLVSRQQNKLRTTILRALESPGASRVLQNLLQELQTTFQTTITASFRSFDLAKDPENVMNRSGWTGLFEWRGIPCIAVLDTALALAWLDACFARSRGNARRLRPLTPMESGMILAMMGHVAHALAAHKGPFLTLQTLEAQIFPVLKAMSSRGPLAALDFQASCGVQHGLLRIITSARDFPDLPYTPPVQDLKTWCQTRKITLCYPVRLAQLSLRIDQVRSLEPGALLLDENIASPQPRLHLSRSFYWDCQIAGDTRQEHRLILKAPHPHGDPSMSDSTPRDWSTLVGDAPIPLTLELGHVELPLQDLVNLAPGDALPLHRPLHAPVSLKAGNQEVARGELVNLEGSLGLRITEVCAP